MRRLLTLFAVVLLFCNASAAPGDTTIVQAHNDKWLDHHGNFDTTVEFPDGSKTYRNIYMTFTVGRYACPGTPQYCGDWDYTVHAIIMTKTGDTLELGRLITPYAGDGWPRTGVNWTNRYVYDVTDFYNILKDSATVRISYSGYSWGFTGNIKFEFVEGTPARNVLGIDRLWSGSYAFGSASDPIDTKITSMNLTAPASTQFSELKFTVSGHGNNNDGCSEFCKKYYEVKLNTNQIAKTDIWRDDCGYNNMYPQNGTWVFNRGNWCPGDIVYTNTHKLPGITGTTNYDLDVDFETYTSSGGGNGTYIVRGMVVYYGAYNKNVDASLDDIVAPTTHEKHFRMNPFTGKPVIMVSNTGATTITSMKIEYSVESHTGTGSYTWNGSMASGESMEIELPVLNSLQSVSDTNVFKANIVEVNGAADADATNNIMSTKFLAAPRYPNDFVVDLRTNKSIVNGVSETKWEIFDVATGSLVQQRSNNAPQTTYKDTVHLSNGVYKLVVTDEGCDGVNWWLYSQYPSPPGSGSVNVKKLTSPIPFQLKNYYNGDFGCGFTQYFNVGWPASVPVVNNLPADMKVFPNPASNSLNIELQGLKEVKGRIQMVDMTGRVVLNMPCTEVMSTVDLSHFSNGMYTVIFFDEESGNTKLQSRVVVAK